MVSFDSLADSLKFSFICPHCHQKTSFYLMHLPSPDWSGDTAASTENYDDVDFCCDHCGHDYSADIFVNMYEGNLVVTDSDTQKEIENVEIKEKYVDEGEYEAAYA
ncbi:MAG: hypothetical protein IJS82_06785 [Paludibacteraceae bacterium]|nr:hypothetical protein [Paludibacteraceae bacterium]